MPFTPKEKRILERHGKYCVMNVAMFVAYINVLLERDPTNRLTIDDPDVRAFLGYRD